MSQPKWDRELNQWLTKPFCTLPGEHMGELTVISMSDPIPFKLQYEVFDITLVPVPFKPCLNKPLDSWCILGNSHRFQSTNSVLRPLVLGSHFLLDVDQCYLNLLFLFYHFSFSVKKLYKDVCRRTIEIQQHTRIFKAIWCLKVHNVHLQLALSISR